MDVFGSVGVLLALYLHVYNIEFVFECEKLREFKSTRVVWNQNSMLITMLIIKVYYPRRQIHYLDGTIGDHAFGCASILTFILVLASCKVQQ